MFVSLLFWLFIGFGSFNFCYLEYYFDGFSVGVFFFSCVVVVALDFTIFRSSESNYIFACNKRHVCEYYYYIYKITFHKTGNKIKKKQASQQSQQPSICMEIKHKLQEPNETM